VLLLAYVIAPVPCPPDAAFVTVAPTVLDIGPAFANAIVWDWIGGGVVPPPPPPQAASSVQTTMHNHKSSLRLPIASTPIFRFQ
jgi:hypothetical protein